MLDNRDPTIEIVHGKSLQHGTTYSIRPAYHKQFDLSEVLYRCHMDSHSTNHMFAYESEAERRRCDSRTCHTLDKLAPREQWPPTVMVQCRKWV